MPSLLSFMRGFDQPKQEASKTDFDPPKKHTRNFYAIGCSILACTTSILLGYDIGVMSGAITYIVREFRITNVQEEVLMGILNVYSLVGSAMAGRTSDWIGRRKTIILAGVIFFVGAVLMGLSTNYTFLMIGRFVAGVGVGYGLMVAPVYTTELAPVSHRGFLTSFPEVFANFGILLGYVSNYGFSQLPSHLDWLSWRLMLGISGIPAILIAVVVVFMPESPRWLVLKGRLAEAKQVLNKTSNSADEAKIRYEEIREEVGIPEDCNEDVVTITKTKNHGEGVWQELIRRPTPAVRHILLCALGVHFFQQVSGIDSVVMYSPVIFGKAGIASESHRLLATIAVGAVKTLFILVATFLLDRVGRRPLMLTSMGGMVICYCGLGLSLFVMDKSGAHNPTWALALSVVTVLASVALFSIGMGPCTWVYSSEIFPLTLRATGTSMGVAINRLLSGIIGMTFLSLNNGLTIGGTFLLYAAFGAVGWIYMYTLFPETGGRPLEEIEALFGTFFRWRTTAKALKQQGNGERPPHNVEVEMV